VFRRRSKPDGEPKAPKPPDKMVIKVRQFRAISAWDRLKLIPGLRDLKVKLRKYEHCEGVDQRLAALGDPEAVRRWPEPKDLSTALRAASARYSDSAAFPTLDTDVLIPHEPEARWARAALGQALDSLSHALPSLPEGFVALLDDDRALIVRPADGGFESALHGEWPADFRALFA
jgi:hypothetical protein